MSTPLEKNIEMDNIQTNNMDKLTMKDNSNDLTSTFDNMSLKTNYGNDKPLNSSLFNNDIFSPFKSNSLNVTKTQSFDEMKKTLDVNKMDNPRLQGNIFTEPDSIKDVSKEVVIEPPKWNYKDPSGKIQGPFLYEEMQEWYNAGYFEKNLPIKKENEVEFKPLAFMIEKYGEEKPFIVDAENYIKKERELKASEVPSVTAAMQPPIASTTVTSKPAIKPIQKTMTTTTATQSTLDASVTSPIGNKTLQMPSYTVGSGFGLGRGIGMKDNNSFSNNLDSMYNSFNNNSVNSPKAYTGRNNTFPSMGNQYEPVGYPGMNRLSNTMNNPQMMGMPGSQPWMPYNDPSMLGLKGWNDMMGFNDIYNNQFYNYDVMNPDMNKSNFNQHFYYQQLMQQSQQFPPQYYQMMRQMPQNQMPMFNMFGQPINTVGMKPMVSNPNAIGSTQSEIIPPMNTTTSNTTTSTTTTTTSATTTTTDNTQTLFTGNEASQNTTNMWNSTPQNTIINNININTNKADNNKTDSIPIVYNTNTNTEQSIETTSPSTNVQENVDDTQKEDTVNDIPINEANTEKDESEEMNNEEPEQNEELEVTQKDNEEEEELVEGEENEEEQEESENNDEDISEPIEGDVQEESPIEGISETKEEEEEEEEEEVEEVVDEEDKSPVTPVPAPAPVKNHWKVSTNKTQRLSIKEIQEMEEKEKMEQLKKQQQEMKEKREAAAAAEAATIETSPVTHEPTTVWGAPHNNIQKPTLRQIMQEEENNKKKQREQMKEAESKKANKSNSHVVINTTRSVWAGRPLTIIADGNSQVVSASSLNTPKPVKKEIISTANTRPQPSQVSTSVNSTPTTARSDNEWTPVGKVVKKSEQPSHRITKTTSKSDNTKKGPSDAFMKWCKNSLRVCTSAGVNVDEFVNLLMPLNETTVINDICTDTLGGITAIDPLKFAEEFIKRRKMDQNDPSFSAVRGYNSFTHDDSRNSNKFIPVKSSGRKKNRQNLN